MDTDNQLHSLVLVCAKLCDCIKYMQRGDPGEAEAKRREAETELMKLINQIGPQGRPGQS